jgi:hypothetical protein
MGLAVLYALTCLTGCASTSTENKAATTKTAA